MIDRLAWLSSAVGLRAWAPPAQPRQASLSARCRAWISSHREHLWIGVILLVAALAHGINMFQLPYFENDEGTYMSQAWSVLSEGQLAPYTYWYDHAPLGWIQIAGWTLISGGMSAFGPSVYSGRIFMLLLQIGSVFMLYMIARRLTGSILVATITALAFSLSAWGIYYHRRVLLDNITTFWMLLSLYLLVSPRVSLRRIWVSAAALGISVLSKELTIFLIPVLALLVFDRSSKGQRAFAMTTWIVIVGSVISFYPLMAILKGELFPPGHGLFETLHPHTSLLGAANYQDSRGRDGGLFSASSQFWVMMRAWTQSDPLLVIGGSLASIFNALRVYRNRLIGIMGLLTLSLYMFLARGGEVLGFYLVPLLPLFALNLGLVLQVVLQGASQLTARHATARRSLLLALSAAVLAIYARLIVAGYQSPQLAFASNPLQLWTSNQSVAQVQALDWVQTHIPARDCIIVDDYMWTDLAAGYGNAMPFTCVHWYWKVDKDTAITGPIFHNRWQTADYVIQTGQMLNDAHTPGSGLNIVSAAIAHSVEIKHFDTGGWAIDVRKVEHPAPTVARASRRPTHRTAARQPTRAAVAQIVARQPMALPSAGDSPIPQNTASSMSGLFNTVAKARIARDDSQSAAQIARQLAGFSISQPASRHYAAGRKPHRVSTRLPGSAHVPIRTLVLGWAARAAAARVALRSYSHHVAASGRRVLVATMRPRSACVVPQYSYEPLR
jgi:hypothetical protein